MNKVYIVTSGDYSDYTINRVFSNREAAEKCCAAWESIMYEPKIEEYELEDGSNIEIERVYKAISFDMGYSLFYDVTYLDYTMMYNAKPFCEKIARKEKTRLRDGRTIEFYYGVIPVNKTVTTYEEAKKLVYDYLAKRKAERLGL